MPDVFADIDRCWIATCRSPGAPQIYRSWLAAEPVLAVCSGLRAVTRAARGLDGDDLDKRDELQRALLRIARNDSTARHAMLHVVRPGLSQVARRYRHCWGEEETDAMVVDFALQRIADYPRRSTARPAPSIVHGVRNDLWNQRLEQLSGPQPLGGTLEIDDVVPPSDGDGNAGEELLELVLRGVRTGYVSERGARLILLQRLWDVPTTDLAEHEGRDSAAIRKYRNRAELALAHLAASTPGN